MTTTPAAVPHLITLTARLPMRGMFGLVLGKSGDLLLLGFPLFMCGFEAAGIRTAGP